jgi:thiamine biosynthesis lipoprotein
MATLFEVLAVGVDREHLEAVGEAALDEVQRIERLLSRHDQATEVSRINREAAGRPVRVDRELFAILADCRYLFGRTNGYFDICAIGLPDSPRFGEAVDLDAERMTVRFIDPKARLDFGGYGKGYALDAAGGVLEAFGVDSALIHGGTSSILIRGRREDGSAWRVGLRDPFGADASSEAARVELTDCGVSSSAAFDLGSQGSDIVNPLESRVVDRQSGCSVIASTALEAEVLSTALLAMGKARAATFLGSQTGEVVPRSSRCPTSPHPGPPPHGGRESIQSPPPFRGRVGWGVPHRQTPWNDPAHPGLKVAWIDQDGVEWFVAGDMR